MELYLCSVGIVAPGLVGWEQARPVLGGDDPYQPAPLPRYAPTMLPANERRRTTATIKLALQAAAEATSAEPVRSPAAIFSSSDGDLDIVDRLCSALALAGRPVSPTHFHNSVHNAPAGYWSIGSGVTAPSTSLSAWHGSFAAGLLEAATMSVAEARPTLLVAYDHPAPAPLDRIRPMSAPFAVALVLRPDRPETPMARLRVQLGRGDEMRLSGELEALRLGNPAARALPLLAALAGNEATSVKLPYLDETAVEVRCESC